MKKFKFPKLDFLKKGNGKPRKKKTWIDILNIILCTVLILGVLGGTATILVFKNWIDSAPEMDMNHLRNPDSSRIFASDGTLIANLGDFTQQNVTYDQFPQALIDAFVAVEDSRFFEHNGFDLPRFTKAVIENLKTFNFDQGGSTLTMQLTRQSWLSLDKSVPRKVREIYMSIKLEQNISKKVVLEYYLNKINFGASTSRGIQAASQYYFNKDISDLSLTECAYLAGVINRPNGFNAYSELDAATNRRNVVLDLMVRHGYIDREEGILAKNIKLEDILNDKNDKQDVRSLKYLAYVNTVVEEVIRVTGYDPFITPMDIYTYMNIEIQEEIERVLADDSNFPNHDLMQAVIVTMNNQTGEVIGIGGGRGEIVIKGHNRATSMYKQPGSTVKPFLSYAMAFEYLGYATSHVVEDRPMYFRGSNRMLSNADRQYRGQVSFRDAMGRSLNIPAYALLEQVSDTVSDARIVEYLQSLGFGQVNMNNFSLMHSIGGGSFEVSPMQMAGAYAVLMNGGYYIEPHTIRRIEYKSGNLPEERIVAKTQVLSEQAAYLSAELMRTNVTSSYSNYMQILGRHGYPVYAKTGTTDWGDSGVQFGIPLRAGKDKWMVASTDQYTTAVWVGFDKGVKDADTYFTAAINRMNVPGRLNDAILTKLVAVTGERPAAVPRPDGISEITHVVAVYPYASPYEGMDSSWVTSGLIKSDNASLVPFQGEALQPLSSFDAAGVQSGSLSKSFNITLPGYPGGTSSAESREYDISLVSSSGQVLQAATGTLLFSPSWVLSIEYGARILVNGAVVADNRYNSNSFTISADIPNDATVKVCGYYSRSNGSQRSNEICRDFDFSSSFITVPNFATYTQLTDFIATYGLSWSISQTPATRVDDIGKVVSGGSTVDLRGTNRTLNELKAISSVTFYSDTTITLPSAGTTSAQASTFFANLGVQYSSGSLSSTEVVSSYVISGNAYTPGTQIPLSILQNVVVTPSGTSRSVSITSSGTQLTAHPTGFSNPVYVWVNTSTNAQVGTSQTYSPSEAGTYKVLVYENGTGTPAEASVTYP